MAFSSITDAHKFETVFVGLNNFKEVFNDVDYWPALKESLIGLIDIPIVIMFSLFVAILLNKDIKGKGFFRAMFLLPLLLGTGTVMNAITGESSQVALSIGVAQQSGAGADAVISFQDLQLTEQLTTLLGSTLSGYLSTVINKISSVMWISGIQIIIFLGMLQTIPKQLYEASVVDGASEFDKLWKITIPLVMPAVQLNTIFTLITSFTSLDNAVMNYVMDKSFKDNLLSYGSALSWIYLLIIGIILSIVFAFMRRRTFYMG